MSVLKTLPNIHQQSVSATAASNTNGSNVSKFVSCVGGALKARVNEAITGIAGLQISNTTSKMQMCRGTT